MSDWIDVETELPPDNVKVFLNVDDFKYLINIPVGYHNKDGWFCKDGKVNVLQWMERDASMFVEN